MWHGPVAIRVETARGRQWYTLHVHCTCAARFSWRKEVDLDIDLELLGAFESHLDPRHPEQGAIPAGVLGYGEISTVFEIGSGPQADVAYKRMPIFENVAELEEYRRVFDEYNRLLVSEVGLRLPRYGFATVRGRGGSPVVFLAQEKFDPSSIANVVLHRIGPDDAVRLFVAVLERLVLVWEYNARRDGVLLGIDGQMSNWAVTSIGPGGDALPGDPGLVYLDTSTPFIRLDGAEQLNPELFLRGAPSFMSWLLKALFLQGVMDRYYDFHLVVVDLIANFYKERLAGLIPRLVDAANDFFSGGAPDLALGTVTEKEVRSYYREDALIWRLYLGARKADRFLRTRLSRRGYPYILPGKIRR